MDPQAQSVELLEHEVHVLTQKILRVRQDEPIVEKVENTLTPCTVIGVKAASATLVKTQGQTEGQDLELVCSGMLDSTVLFWMDSCPMSWLSSGPPEEGAPEPW